MAQTVQLKRSSVANKVPTTSDLALGELALNTYDGRLFFKKDPGTASIVTVATTDDAQTLTNKTLSAATLTGSLTAGGGTGSSGQVLTSTGSGVYWSTVAGGSGLTASSYVCIARLSTDQTIANNTDVLVNFIDQDDPQGWWDPTSKQFTPNVAGYYEINFAGWWDTASTSTGQNNIQMRKNGNTVGISQDPLNSTAGSGQSQILSKAVYLNGSTDYIDFTAYTNNTTSQVLKYGTVGGSGTYFTAHLIAAGGATTNLTTSADGTSFTIVSDTGTDAVISAANSTTAGVMTTGSQTFAGTKTFSSTISGSITGNAGTATALQTGRTISLGGDLSGSASFDGSANVTISATIQPNSVALGTDTTGDYVSGLTGGTGVTISGSAGEGWSPTVAIGQDVSTTASVQFGSLVLSGNLTVNGTTTTISANNLAIQDNLIYLNDGSTITNPDLGIVGNYNDGSYSHAGIFRDATDNRWKFFKRYDPEPGQTIDTANSTFQYADVQANTFYGDLSGNATTATTLQTARTINGTSFNGSANITVTAVNPNALTIGTGLSGTSYDGSSAVTIAIDSTVATLTGSQTLTNKTISSGVLTGTLTANSEVGTSGQVLTSSGSGVYWSTVSGGGGGGATNLTLSANSTTVTVLSDTGTDAVILAANSTTAGVMTADTQTIGGAKTFANDASFSANVAITGTVTSGIWNSEVMSRAVSYTDATSITINADTTDLATMVNTQATGTFTINAPTGTLFNGQKLMFRIKSTNVQTFSWNAVFAGSTDAPLPTASSGSSLTDYLGFIYDSTASKWHVIAKNFGY